MPRTGSFPLGVAIELIQTYGQRGQVLLDPFCGKGTSLLAGRLLGLHPFGLDIAPEAIHCSRAKLDRVSLAEVRAYVDELELSSVDICATPPDIKALFHASTLRELLSVREKLIGESRIAGKRQAQANMVLAATLGILHGHAEYSLSISSAHAYSMAPSYVRRFAREHGLRKPRRALKKCLDSKLERVLRDPLPVTTMGGVAHADVMNITSALRSIRGDVDLTLM
jgi:site-specific DNA-methyltransferase (adenine-specific)